MQLVLKFLDDLWNLKWVTGHRTQIAQIALVAVSGLMAYQGLATDPALIGAGVDLPDLPPQALMALGPVAAYFGAKVKQFAQEHQPPPPAP